MNPVDAAALLSGFASTNTGGGCTALHRALPEVGLEILITAAHDAEAPKSLREPVLVGLYAVADSKQVATIHGDNLFTALGKITRGEWQVVT